MKFFAFLFSIIYLFALIDAKGEVVQRKEDSPLRVALRRGKLQINIFNEKNYLNSLSI